MRGAVELVEHVEVDEDQQDHEDDCDEPGQEGVLPLEERGGAGLDRPCDRLHQVSAFVLGQHVAYAHGREQQRQDRRDNGEDQNFHAGPLTNRSIPCGSGNGRKGCFARRQDIAQAITRQFRDLQGSRGDEGVEG